MTALAAIVRMLLLPPEIGQRSKEFFNRGNRLVFVAEVVRLGIRLTANALILTNPATKILHSVGDQGRRWPVVGWAASFNSNRLTRLVEEASQNHYRPPR